jgi:hypothetical protein
MYRVTLTACTAGNPLQAWHGTTGEDDEEHVPDDVWADVAYEFNDDLDAAKAYVAGMDPQMTTHVRIEHDGVVIYDQDAGADHLDDAAPGVVMPHTIDAGGPVEDVAGEAPPPFAPPPSEVATEVAP